MFTRFRLPASISTTVIFPRTSDASSIRRSVDFKYLLIIKILQSHPVDGILSLVSHIVPLKMRLIGACIVIHSIYHYAQTLAVSNLETRRPRQQQLQERYKLYTHPTRCVQYNPHSDCYANKSLLNLTERIELSCYIVLSLIKCEKSISQLILTKHSFSKLIERNSSPFRGTKAAFQEEQEILSSSPNGNW